MAEKDLALQNSAANKGAGECGSNVACSKALVWARSREIAAALAPASSAWSGDHPVIGGRDGVIALACSAPLETHEWRLDKRDALLLLLLLQGSLIASGGGAPPPPYHGVDATLRGLAGAAEGFGAASIGGLEGDTYSVTNLLDDGPGSLRYAAARDEPLWVVFNVSGTISLASPLRVTSHKTIDGRGQRIKITGNGLLLQSCEHVIVNNLEFERGRGDAITIVADAKDVWIDRCTLSDYNDGLIDITRRSTRVTVSRCHFYRHKKTMLISANPRHVGDRNIKVTIHHCYFDQTQERHPRVRFAKVHLYNNYFREWGVYGVRASVEAQIVSEHNVYEAGTSKRAFDYFIEKAPDSDIAVAGSISSDGDVFLNGAEGPANSTAFLPEDYYSVNPKVQPAGKQLVRVIRETAGWQNIPLPGS
ncbi:putative pectate lyase 21 [Selaginella moellendorffii]|uniref:putative pectate lyase 21 n=1 Tax=Selaginella moellendorffii TaxID=88036 RepID=UPI000D1C86F4|nr:putative pectate lyase 21 [Selaginella moellendorffii]|eukprot:XP_024533220.1 putative pectate lyase 21 [Selaginella moellendorffii]